MNRTEQIFPHCSTCTHKKIQYKEEPCATCKYNSFDKTAKDKYERKGETEMINKEIKESCSNCMHGGIDSKSYPCIKCNLNNLEIKNYYKKEVGE